MLGSSISATDEKLLMTTEESSRHDRTKITDVMDTLLMRSGDQGMVLTLL